MTDTATQSQTRSNEVTQGQIVPPLAQFFLELSSCFKRLADLAAFPCSACNCNGLMLMVLMLGVL